MQVYLPSYGLIPALFIKYLQSLPTLHTLEVRVLGGTMTLLKKALKGVRLPQIKTLIIPSAGRFLPRHCHDVEEIVCVVYGDPTTYEEFLQSLISVQNSKVRRSAITLDFSSNPFRE